MDAPARPVVVHYEPKPPSEGSGRDDIAYILPMLAFLLFTWVGTNETIKKFVPAAYVISYVAKTVVVAVLLIVLRRHYTKIRWNHWWLGVMVGVIGIFQWVPMQLWLQNHFGFFKPPDPADVFNPYRDIASANARLAFIGVRMVGAVLLVPVMEELFWRDYLWRTLLAPNDFRLASVGEWDGKVFLIVAAAFATVHVQWMTAVVWGLMIGWLLVYTKSLGACIIAHAVTNLLLAVYVLRTQDWAFW
jgi:hypothetical protein